MDRKINSQTCFDEFFGLKLRPAFGLGSLLTGSSKLSTPNRAEECHSHAIAQSNVSDLQQSTMIAGDGSIKLRAAPVNETSLCGRNAERYRRPMTFAYSIQLSDSAVQATLLQTLKSAKAEVIQTGSGLCVKTEMTEAELTKLAGDGAQVAKLDGHAADLTPDVRAFLSGK